MTYVDWWYEEHGPGQLGDMVSGSVEAQAKVEEKAAELFMLAELQLAPHKHTFPGAHLGIHRMNDYDVLVVLHDADPGGKAREVTENTPRRSALSIENGWWEYKRFGKKLKHPIWHEGLHVLEHAAEAMEVVL